MTDKDLLRCEAKEKKAEEPKTTMSTSEYIDNDLLAFFSDEEGLPTFDATYAEHLQLQEAIDASFSLNSHEMYITQEKVRASSRKNKNKSDEMGNPANQVKTVGTKKRSITENCESSSTRSWTCDICFVDKTRNEFFRNPRCSHMFCSDCISKHVDSKIQDNITLVRCPDVSCKSVLKSEDCRSVLPSVVYERWDKSLSEDAIPTSQKFYCPYKDCSRFHEIVEGGNITKESECLYCHRLFCANCKVPWHSDLECEEFQMLNNGKETRDDVLFEKLKKRNHWQTCPSCKHVVKRSGGCLHITCRCGFEFCYSCGAQWTLTHNCPRG